MLSSHVSYYIAELDSWKVRVAPGMDKDEDEGLRLTAALEGQSHSAAVPTLRLPLCSVLLSDTNLRETECKESCQCYISKCPGEELFFLMPKDGRREQMKLHRVQSS